MRTALVALLVVAAAPASRASTYVWSGNGATELWSNPNNWQNSSVPSANEAAPVIVEFPANISGSVTNDIVALKVDSLRLLGSGLFINGASSVSLTLRGGNSSTNIYSAGGNYIGATLPLVLDGTNRVVSPVLFSLYSPVSGNGGFSIEGAMRFDGNEVNTYTGATILKSGVLTLDRVFFIIGNSFGVVSTPGPLVIENGLVLALQDDNIADASSVVVHQGGTLSLNGHDDTVGGLTLLGGDVTTGTGTLTLGGNVNVDAGNSIIAGRLSLGGATRTFQVAGVNTSLEITATLSGGAGIGLPGIIKEGSGELSLAAANTYPGSTTVNGGTLEVRNPSALGSGAFGGTSVASGATLNLVDGLTILGEPLTLNGGKLRSEGTASWTGTIMLNDNSAMQVSVAGEILTLSGAITGTGGFTQSGNGTLRLAGTNSNTYTGTTMMGNGFLSLAKSAGSTAIPGDLVIGGLFGANNTDVVYLNDANQISEIGTVTIYNSGLLTLQGHNESLGRLVLYGGEIQTDLGTLTLTTNVTVGASSEPSKIFGKLALGSATRTFNTHASPIEPALDLNAVVSGGLGIGLTKAGAGEMRLSGDNTYFGATTVAEGVLTLGHGQALGDANPFNVGNGTIVMSGATLILDNIDVGSEKLTLNGAGVNTLGALLSQVGNNSWTGPVQINSDAVVNASFGSPLTFSGVVSGNGKLTKTGAATLTFSGAVPNTHSGETTVAAGSLILNKSNGVSALAGPLIIGDDQGGVGADRLVLASDDQIDDDQQVTVRSSGELAIYSFNDAFNHLYLHAGGISGTTGKITPKMGITALSGYSTLDARLQLHTATTPITSLSNASIYITGEVGGGGIYKSGTGSIDLAASNSFVSTVTVAEGALHVSHNHALGSTGADTWVLNGASLFLQDDVNVIGEKLYLRGVGKYGTGGVLAISGTNSWSGPIVLDQDSWVFSYPNSRFTAVGPVSGAGGLTVQGSGIVRLYGDVENDYAGSTLVKSGTLVLNKLPGLKAIPGPLTIGDGSGGANVDVVALGAPNQIADAAPVTIASSGVLKLNGLAETVSSLAGNGGVELNTGTLTVGANDGSSTFAGILSGLSGDLLKIGNGTFTIAGTNTHTGNTTVQAGTLLVNGSQSFSPVIVNTGARLGGSGVVANTTAAGGTVSPGNSVGLLHSKNVAWNSNSKFKVELNGTTPGLNQDQLDVNGTVNLGLCALQASLGFGGAVSNNYVIIKNDGFDPVASQFSGLPEGQFLYINSTQFQITYHGGDGNDVVLRQTSTTQPPIIDSIVKLPNGFVQLNGSGIPFHLYTIERSEDLQIWISLETTASNDGGGISYADPDGFSLPKAFYRLLAVEDDGQF